MIIDQLGRNVNIPDNLKRIVTLVPSQTELLFWLGLNESIIGITRYCIHPKELCDQKVKVGGTKKLDLNKIRGLKPDLIIANKEENVKEQVEDLMRDFPVWISDVHDLSSAFEMIRLVGEMTGTRSKAEELITTVSAGFNLLQPKRFYKVAYLIWRKPYMVAGGGTFINDMLKRCGLINVFENIGRYPSLNASEITDASPELVLLSSEPYPFKQIHVAELQAIYPNARVMLVDGEMFSWYGSRMINAITYFKELI